MDNSSPPDKKGKDRSRRAMNRKVGCFIILLKKYGRTENPARPICRNLKKLSRLGNFL
jgi:hypothetical protein